jgi:hypothetical protein
MFHMAIRVNFSLWNPMIDCYDISFFRFIKILSRFINAEITLCMELDSIEAFLVAVIQNLVL